MISGLPVPKKFTLVASSAEGKTELGAFDRALLTAGIGNMNLLKVSSILPPGSQYISEISIPQGYLLPIAYASLSSRRSGELISAAIGVGISTEKYPGVIMEFSGFCAKKDAEKEVSKMIIEAFEVRGIPLNKTIIKGVEHKVKELGCVFAGVPLWF